MHSLCSGTRHPHHGVDLGGGVAEQLPGGANFKREAQAEQNLAQIERSRGGAYLQGERWELVSEAKRGVPPGEIGVHAIEGLFVLPCVAEQLPR